MLLVLTFHPGQCCRACLPVDAPVICMDSIALGLRIHGRCTCSRGCCCSGARFCPLPRRPRLLLTCLSVMIRSDCPGSVFPGPDASPLPVLQGLLCMTAAAGVGSRPGRPAHVAELVSRSRNQTFRSITVPNLLQGLLLQRCTLLGFIKVRPAPTAEHGSLSTSRTALQSDPE